MKNFINYSFTILLTLTCLIAFPTAINEITGQREETPVIEEPIIPEIKYEEDTNTNNTIDTVYDNATDTNFTQNNSDPTDFIDSTEIESDIADDITTDNSPAKPVQEKHEQEKVEEVDTPTVDIPKEDNSESNTKYSFSTVTSDYFDDALFIGDSRTVGLSEYGDLGQATFFASNGMSVYNVFTSEISIPSIGKTTLENLLTNKDFTKVYLMLGINELGYDFNTSIDMYLSLVKTIIDLAPEAIIYVQANLHVSQSRSESDKIFNNINIDKFNSSVAKLADNKTIFYIDVNHLFDDENGNLSTDYTADNTHVLGRYYNDWSSWLYTKAIEKTT